MPADINDVYDSLVKLSKAVTDGYPNDSLFSDNWGGLAPPINRHEAAEQASSLAAEIEGLAKYPESASISAEELVRRIGLLITNTVPQMYNGNIGQAYPVYVGTLRMIREFMFPRVVWLPIDRTMLPANVARKVVAAQHRVDEIESSIPHLAQKIADIQAAHQVADNLEVDLQALAEARAKVEKAVADAVLKSAQMDAQLIQSNTLLATFMAREEVVAKLVAQCEAAYHITTTKGLAGAFDQRAISLRWSMRGWVVGLFGALIAASWIGASRLETLARVLSADDPKLTLVISQILLSLLGVGAPIWFAWLATKQIGQRFRLAEDYAFKASVAKAYEGYRKEAAELDPEFQSALFRSALQRLDEAPLRLVEPHQAASPLQDFANSDLVRNAIKIAPDLPSKLMNTVNDTLNQVRAAASEAKKVVTEVKKSTVDGES